VKQNKTKQNKSINQSNSSSPTSALKVSNINISKQPCTTYVNQTTKQTSHHNFVPQPSPANATPSLNTILIVISNLPYTCQRRVVLESLGDVTSACVADIVMIKT
jgi:hypothetical protein